MSRRLSIDCFDAQQVIVDVTEVIVQACADRRHATAVQLAGDFQQRLRWRDRASSTCASGSRAPRSAPASSGRRRCAPRPLRSRRSVPRAPGSSDRRRCPSARRARRPDHACSSSGSCSQRRRTSVKPTCASRRTDTMYCGPTKIATSPVLQFGSGEFDQPHHDEQRRSVFVDLRPLVALLGVFDGELVKAELFLQHGELARVRDPSARPTRSSRGAGGCARTSLSGMSLSFSPR